jgi:hypothetical protein
MFFGSFCKSSKCDSWKFERVGSVSKTSDVTENGILISAREIEVTIQDKEEFHCVVMIVFYVVFTCIVF